MPSDRIPGGVLVVAEGTPRTFRSTWVGRTEESDEHLVVNRNPWVLGSSEPTPEELLRKGRSAGRAWVKPSQLDSNRGVQGEPCTGVAKSDNISRCPTPRTPCQHRAQRALCGAAMRAPLGGRTQPLHWVFFEELVFSFKTTVLAATAATAGVF